MKQYQIKGIRMTPAEYQRLHFVIVNEEQQGWKPTKADVKELLKSDRHPSDDIQKTVDNAVKEMRNHE